MSDYTPTTSEVRKMYKAGAWLRGDRNPDQFNPAAYEPIYFAEFDRWLAEVERAAAEKAWGEGHEVVCEDAEHVCEKFHPNPYRREGKEQ